MKMVQWGPNFPSAIDSQEQIGKMLNLVLSWIFVKATYLSLLELGSLNNGGSIREDKHASKTMRIKL